MALTDTAPLYLEFPVCPASSPFLSKMSITEGMLKGFSNRFDLGTSFTESKAGSDILNLLSVLG